MSTQHLKCPSCHSIELKPVLEATDYLVSQKRFTIYTCLHCELHVTAGAPGEDEIAPYYESEAYISHTDTRKGILNKLYHWARKKALKTKVSWVKEATHLASGHLLDIGSGTGAFLHTMQQSGWKTMGIEPNPTARALAKEHYGMESFHPSKLEELEEGCFDAITLWHVLEHVHHLHEYLERIKKLLKPTGILILAVPNIQSTDFQFYKEFWAALDVPRHLYHFTPKSMEFLLESHQFKLKKHISMPFDAFYISLLSEKYKAGKGSWMRGWIIGLYSWLRSRRSWKDASSIVYIAAKS